MEITNEEIGRLARQPEALGLGANALAAFARARGFRLSVPRARAWLRQNNEVVARMTTRAGVLVAQKMRRIDVRVMNELHHADLLYLPEDNGYRYALVVVDAATRYKQVEPLRSKDSTEVAEAFERMYGRATRSPLRWPKRLRTDSGSEFAGRVAAVMREHGVRMERGEPGDHKHAAFAEAANRVLGRRLFAGQHADELRAGRVSRAWVERARAVVSAMNALPTRLLGMSPNDAVKARGNKGPAALPAKVRASLRRLIEREKLLRAGTRVRYALARPADGGDFRETDLRWSGDTAAISEIRMRPGVPIEYRLDSGPRRWWLRPELLPL